MSKSEVNASKRIVIIDGQHDFIDTALTNYLIQLKEKIENESTHKVRIIHLAEHRIDFCSGCFGCWIETPGLCSSKDEGDDFRKLWIESDLMIFASPLIAGFVSWRIKTLADKFLPLVLPFIGLVDGEMRHDHRYEHLVPLACIFQPGPDDTQEDIDVNTNWVERVAYQIDEPLAFSETMECDPSVIVEKIQDFFSLPKKSPDKMTWLEPIGFACPKEKRISQKLVAINGSNRAKSNTGILLTQIQEGFIGGSPNTVIQIKVNNKINIDKALKAIDENDQILIAMPLYVHAMPGHVKKFLEELDENLNIEGKTISFLIQSGFFEAHHSRWLEAYFVRLAHRWNVHLGGIIVRGGVEGIQIQPPSMTKGLFAEMREIGEQLAASGFVSNELISQIGRREKFSAGFKMVYKMLKITGLVNFFWNKQLKENNAFEKRFDRPLV